MSSHVIAGVLVISLIAACGGSEPPPPPPPCGPSNCAGCCSAGVCQGGASPSACGLGGGACQPCGAALACLANGTCGLDPQGVWKLQPVSAQIAANNNGTAWDGDSSPPDVFVVIACPGNPDTSGQTATVESNTPTWSSGGCTATASDLLNRGFGLQVWDEDALFDDTITASLSLTGLTQAHFQAGAVDLNPTGGLVSLRIALQKQ